MTESVLITGIDGFLGQHLLSALNGKGYRVVGLNRTESAREKENAEVKIYNHPEAIFRDEPAFKYIFHLAAYIPYGKFHQPDAALYTTNIKLTGSLAESYASSRFIFASSVAVYGYPLQVPLGVYSAFNNPDYYGLSKLAGEAIVKNHPDYAIVRFSSVIGKGMKPVSLIPRMIEQAKKNKRIEIWGNGERLQNYIDVRDAAKLCTHCADVNENVIALGVGDKSYSNNEVAQIIAQHTGASIVHKGEDESPSFVYDPGGEYNTLHFNPEIALAQTIAEMIV